MIKAKRPLEPTTEDRRGGYACGGRPQEGHVVIEVDIGHACGLAFARECLKPIQGKDSCKLLILAKCNSDAVSTADET